ncbi:hypothetical protein ACJW30_07G162100 [Castanea mollissima]
MVVKPFHGQRLLVVLVLVSIGIEHMFQKFHSMNQVICVNTFLDRNFLLRQSMSNKTAAQMTTKVSNNNILW